jgi:hypothetical protein
LEQWASTANYDGQASHDYSWFGFIGNVVLKIFP